MRCDEWGMPDWVGGEARHDGSIFDGDIKKSRSLIDGMESITTVGLAGTYTPFPFQLRLFRGTRCRV